MKKEGIPSRVLARKAEITLKYVNVEYTEFVITRRGRRDSAQRWATTRNRCCFLVRGCRGHKSIQAKSD